MCHPTLYQRAMHFYGRPRETITVRIGLKSSGKTGNNVFVYKNVDCNMA